MSDPEVRTTLPNARQFPRFAGISTFGRFPRLEDVPAAQRPVDWVVYGVPYDGAVTYRPGARFGPRSIREASQYLKPYHLEQDVHLARVFSLADGGDSPVRPYSCRETLDAAIEFAGGLGEPGHTRLFAVGGDHSIAYANMRATWERWGRPSGGLALVHFDAHLDTADVVWGEKWTHASPFIRAIEDGILNPKRMISVGIRGPLNTPDDLQFARDHGVTLITADQVTEVGAVAAYDAFLDALGDLPTYLTFDIDCVDPAFAPGTGTPCCGGLTTIQAFDWLRRCRRVNLVGADLVEVLPDRDPAGVTALLASHVIFEILAASAAHHVSARA